MAEPTLDISRKYKATVDWLLKYENLRRSMLGPIEWVGWRPQPVRGLYMTFVDKERRARLSQNETGEVKCDPLFEVITSEFPVEALAHFVIARVQLDARDVDCLVAINSSLRRYFSRLNWFPGTIVAVSFGLATLAIHHSATLAMSWREAGALFLVLVAFLFMWRWLLPAAPLGWAASRFDSIELLLDVCAVVLRRGTVVPVVSGNSVDLR